MIIRQGGPISWRAFRIERTSRSTCEAEIRATDECAKDTLSVRLRCDDLLLDDTNIATPIYNDNQGCVDWCKSTTTKGMKHVSLRDCAVRESVVHKELTIQHVAGKRNPADLFTKELRDGAHFRKLRNSFMTTREQFTIDSTSSVPSVSPLNHSLPTSPPPLLDSTTSSPQVSWNLNTKTPPLRENRKPVPRISKPPSLSFGNNYSTIPTRNRYRTRV